MAKTKATGFRIFCWLTASLIAAGDGPCEISGGYNYKRLSTTTWFMAIQGIGPCVTLGATNCSWTLRFCGDGKLPMPPCGQDTVCETYAPSKYQTIGHFRTLVPNGQHSFVAKFEQPGGTELKCNDQSKTLRINVIFACNSQKHLPIGPGSLLTNLDYSNIDDRDACERNVTVPYDGACGTAPPSGGLSTGSVLLILFFVALLLYLLGGILINRNNGAQGVEMIPHLQFWKELPSLIVEGGVFFVQVVTCQSDGPSRTYDNI